MMRIPTKARQALLATVMLGVAAVTTLALTASPAPAAASSNCTYYSDASKTTVVGKFGKDCCNNNVAWGVKTKWSTCGGCFICFPPPR